MNGIIISLITFVGMIGINNTPTEPVAGTILQSCSHEEVLWLARVTFSETKITEEMPYIAWVVRNRVDTNYMGTTYKEVALSPNQFSGLNIGDKQYHTNISLPDNSQNTKWQQALSVAEEVCTAPESERLFPITVRHFYSPRSVVGGPSWAKDEALYYTIKSTSGHEDRFAFYNSIR